MTNQPTVAKSSDRETTESEQVGSTTVELRCTGRIRDVVGEPTLEYQFDGTTLRALLSSVFEEYPVEEMLIAETEKEATTDGWAPEISDLPGTSYSKNPEGDQTRPYARVTVNGRFNEHLDGLDTELEAGDRIGLMYPFIYCC